MTKLNFDFDARTIETTDTFELLPSAWYKAFIEDVTIMPTKKRDGNYMMIKFKVLEGKHKNRVVFTNLNIDNPNQKTVEIAQKNLASLCKCVELFVIKDTDQLIGKQLQIKIGVTEGRDGYEPRNDVKGYKKFEDIEEKMHSKKKEENEDDLPDWLKE